MAETEPFEAAAVAVAGAKAAARPSPPSVAAAGRDLEER